MILSKRERADFITYAVAYVINNFKVLVFIKFFAIFAVIYYDY